MLFRSLTGAGFSLVGLGALLSRRPVPDLVRTEFSLAGIASCVYLMRGLPAITWWRFLGWLALGLFIYSLYGARHSRLLPQVVRRPSGLGLLSAAAMIGAVLAWWLLPHPASLLAPIGILTAFSLAALWLNGRQAA